MKYKQLNGCDEKFAKILLSGRKSTADIRILDSLNLNRKSNINFQLNLYDFYFLVAHAQFEYNDLLSINLDEFKNMAHLIDSLYFICSFQNNLRSWSIEYIIYNSSYKKTFLIKKLVLNKFKKMFTNISLDDALSKGTDLTIFNPNI